MIKVAFFTRYDLNGASSRVRATQYHQLLAAHGIQAVTLPLLSDRYLSLLYAGRRSISETLRCYWQRLAGIPRVGAFDLLWIEKELLPFVPAPVEAWLLRGRAYVLDFDDPIFHNYDQSRSALVRGWLGNKIDRLMAGARLVTVGNSYLEARARTAGAPWVERLPSVIDLDRYPAPPSVRPPRASDSPLRVVWIGSPATVHYLNLVREPLLRVAMRLPLELRVIGAEAPVWPGVQASSIAWSIETEAAEISSGDVGIMPLDDTPWERGKCGFKLIQYMACGLPVVASPVGMNRDIVAPGADGLLATTRAEWETALLQLGTAPALRQAMGQLGRAKVETQYCIQVTGPRLAHLLHQVAA
jgi:glycosyltransferase involved in cell wall biosynthesis